MTRLQLLKAQVTLLKMLPNRAGEEVAHEPWSPHPTPTMLFPEDASYADVRFTPLPLAFNHSMWWELIRDCGNADAYLQMLYEGWQLRAAIFLNII